MKTYKHLRYSILYRLKRGVSISISLTFRCNYNCPYCSMRIGNEHGPRSAESSLMQWLDLVDSFPYRLKEVFVSGGEPTLMPYFSELVEALIDRRILVTVFTNLSNDIAVNLTPSPYLRIQASYHPQAKEEQFIGRLVRAKSRGHQISVDEVGIHRLSYPTDVKPKITTDTELKADNARLRFAPDRTGHITCYDLYNHVT